jgi:hypothetical protein
VSFEPATYADNLNRNVIVCDIFLGLSDADLSTTLITWYRIKCDELRGMFEDVSNKFSE